MAKVAFVDLFRLFYDRHGVYSLTSSMKQHGIDVSYVGERSRKNALRKIAGIGPDLLLYSAVSATVPAYIEFDKIAKKIINAKSLIGGPGPTFDWACIKDSSIDASCIGEGETAIIDFIKGGFRSNKNIFCRGDRTPSEFHPLVELDILPLPDRNGVYKADALLRNNPAKSFISGKGCPYQCTYCFNHKQRDIFNGYGPPIRKKSVDYLMDEIRSVKKKYPLKTVVFCDDTFILNKKWFLEFCERFPREVGLPYTCNVRANLVDEEIAKALSESNCSAVGWSIESGNDFLRNTVLKRGMSNEHILKTAYLLHKYSIPNRVGNMIGLPGENFEQMLQTLELNIEARPSFGFTCIFVPFPGLELTQYAIDHGYYEPNARGALPNMRTKASVKISPAENRQIQKLQCLFPLFVRFPRLYTDRRMRKLLFGSPLLFLRMFFWVFYAYNLMKLYVTDAPLPYRCRVAARYIINSICKIE